MRGASTFCSRAALWCCIISTVLFVVASTPVNAAPPTSGAEHKIKAGMLYNFLKYTNWPSTDAAKPMQICLFGPDVFDRSLAALEGRSVHLRSISVRPQTSPEVAAAQCHLVFVSDIARWPALRKAITGQRVLTVSNAPGFLQQGGMFSFGRADGHIITALNMDALEATNLSVEPRMLKLVKLVRLRSGGH